MTSSTYGIAYSTNISSSISNSISSNVTMIIDGNGDSPPEEEDGSAGVREPRRPLPAAPSAAVVQDEP